jgi:MarR family transcriptional regulator, 2-MHQ and catechol-resistance regulon repressor
MPTRHKGAPNEVLALDTFIKLQRAVNAFDARVMRHHALEDLTLSQFSVLEALYHLGPLSQSEIGAKLLKSGGNITLVIDNLERAGYVARRRCLNDRRIVYVDLTDAGTAKIAQVFPRHAAAIVQEMSALSAEEQQQLGVLLKKLGRAGERAAANGHDALEYEI